MTVHGTGSSHVVYSDGTVAKNDWISLADQQRNDAIDKGEIKVFNQTPGKQYVADTNIEIPPNPHHITTYLEMDDLKRKNQASTTNNTSIISMKKDNGTGNVNVSSGNNTPPPDDNSGHFSILGWQLW